MFEYLSGIFKVLKRIATVTHDRFSPFAEVAVVISIYVVFTTTFIALVTFIVSPFVVVVMPAILVDGWSLIMPVNTVPCLVAIFTAKVVALLFRYKTLISTYITSRASFWR